MSHHLQHALVLSCCIYVFLVGCDTGPQYGEVYGVVAIDDEPLAGANVTFTPTFEEGRPSFGKTDADGKFELSESQQVRGAIVGQYTVRISTFDAGKPDAEPPIPFVQEQVPTKYNIRSTLSREVNPGVNEINFQLDSQGEILQLDEECF